MFLVIRLRCRKFCVSILMKPEPDYSRQLRCHCRNPACVRSGCEHLESLKKVLLFVVNSPQPDNSVGVPERYKDPLCFVELTGVEQFVPAP